MSNWWHNTNKARRLPTIAKWINENTDHKAVIDEGYCNTDRTPRGFRYITHLGKGRYGNRIKVTNPNNEVVLEHNSAETYRMNYEVEQWLEKYFGIITLGDDGNTHFQETPTKNRRGD